MANEIKDLSEILNKLGITHLNKMQVSATSVIPESSEVMLLSPTGSGKTLAFLLPVIEALNPEVTDIQTLIIVPSRELAIQIEQVAREMGTGYKVNAFYGGRSFNKDRIDLKHPPAILIGTPGRIADHLRRTTFSTGKINTLILDEFDKSLEIGFESDMQEIVNALQSVDKKILTSATFGVEVPEFMGMKNLKLLDFLGEGESFLETKLIQSPDKDKISTLIDLLKGVAGEPGIIFCNYKDTIRFISDVLYENDIPHGCFFGGMEQKDRERALIKFRNGTEQLIIATDLAARGLDIPEIKFIIHYQLPPHKEEFTHRNGRTARMNKEGTAYILNWKEARLPAYLKNVYESEIPEEKIVETSDWTTVFVSGGRGDKISKGDIVGFFIKSGGLEKDELGNIELKQDCAFVAVKTTKATQLISKLNNTKLKTKKVRLNEV
jgi:superfamily II DNA/RNA helicase